MVAPLELFTKSAKKLGQHYLLFKIKMIGYLEATALNCGTLQLGFTEPAKTSCLLLKKVINLRFIHGQAKPISFNGAMKRVLV